MIIALFKNVTFKEKTTPGKKGVSIMDILNQKTEPTYSQGYGLTNK